MPADPKRRPGSADLQAGPHFAQKPRCSRKRRGVRSANNLLHQESRPRAASLRLCKVCYTLPVAPCLRASGGNLPGRCMRAVVEPPGHRMRKRAHARHAHRVGRHARGRCRSAFREQRRKLFTIGAKVLGIASYLGAPYKMIGKTLGVDGLPRLLRHLCATPASLAGLRFLLLLQG